MIIGVDAGALSINDERLKVGVYHVTYNLLKTLSEIDPINQYRLYTFIPIPKATMLEFGPRMTNIVLRPSTGWLTIRLPLELSVHPVDVFLGLSQALPKTKARSIGFIYDLGFFYNPAAYGKSATKLKRQTNQLVKQSNEIITISRSSQKDIVKEYAIDKNNVHVFYPGVDERFNPSGPSFTSPNLYFLFVGSLNKAKNISVALRAFNLFLQKTQKQYDFILVGGDYWPDPDIADTIKELDLSGRVIFAGFVSDEKLADYYRGATAFLTTPLREGFCLPAVEAMASGIPVISVDNGAMKEIVGNGGLICDTYDADTLANALKQLVTDRTIYNKLKSAAIQRASYFSWLRFAQSVASLIA